MKKTYIQPQSDAVRLFAEDSLLTGSNTSLKVVDNETIDAGDARSAGMGGWNAADWSNTED